MRLHVGILACLSLCQASLVLATDPPAAPAATQPEQSPPPATAAGTQSATPASAPAAASSTLTPASTPEVSPELDKQLRSQGYKRQVRSGVTYYCHNEADIGSHIERVSCRTAERIAAERVTAKEIMTRAQVETMQTAKP